METLAQMQRNAQRCEAFARDETLSDEERRSFLEAAQNWRMLANQSSQRVSEERPAVRAA
jgi:hypothetical protein